MGLSSLTQILVHAQEGMAASLARQMAAGDRGLKMRRMLQLQRDARDKGDTPASTAFRDTALIQTENWCFGWMRDGCNEIQVVHSAGRFGGIDAGPDVLNAVIGFVGDRDEWGQPPPAIKLPPINAWNMADFEWVDEPQQFGAFYGLLENNKKWWKPATGVATKKAKLPRMILLPGELGLWASEKPRQGWELAAKAAAVIVDDTNDVEEGDMAMVMEYAHAMCQLRGATASTSLLTIEVIAVTTTDSEFGRWKFEKIVGTLGLPQQTVQQQSPHPMWDPSAMMTAMGDARAGAE